MCFFTHCVLKSFVIFGLILKMFLFLVLKIGTFLTKVYENLNFG